MPHQFSHPLSLKKNTLRRKTHYFALYTFLTLCFAKILSIFGCISTFAYLLRDHSSAPIIFAPSIIRIIRFILLLKPPPPPFFLAFSLFYLTKNVLLK